MNWILFALLASVLIGSNTIIRKKVLLQENVLEFMGVSGFFALAIITPFVFYVNILPAKTIFLIFIKSLFAFLFFYLSDRALRHMQISSFAPLANLSPLLLIFLGYIFLGEKLSFWQVAGVFLIVMGAYILELKDGFRHLLEPFYEIQKNKYLHFALLGLLFAAFSASLDRYILKSVNLLDFYFYQRIFIDVLVFVFLFSFFGGVKSMAKTVRTSGWLIILGTLTFLLADFFYYKALMFPTAYIALVIAVKRISTLFATFAGGEIFHEDSLFRKGLACVIMIAGVFLIVR